MLFGCNAWDVQQTHHKTEKNIPELKRCAANHLEWLVTWDLAEVSSELSKTSRGVRESRRFSLSELNRRRRSRHTNCIHWELVLESHASQSRMLPLLHSRLPWLSASDNRILSLIIVWSLWSVKAVFFGNFVYYCCQYNFVKWHEIGIVSLRDGAVLLFVIRI